MNTTQTTAPDTNYEIIDLGNEQFVELESDDHLIKMRVIDEDGEAEATVGLTIEEAEALIAKLAVKVAQARLVDLNKIARTR